MHSKHFDIAIVGQGIAGTLMAYFLQKYGKHILVIDNNFEGASSKVAAGIVNPITGKNFVKSWGVDDFLPIARDIYTQIGNELGIETFTIANIIRSLGSVEDENNWLSRTADQNVMEYVQPFADTSEFENKVSKPFGYGEIKGSFQVHLGEILDAFKQKWQEENVYFETKFDYEALQILQPNFCYKNYTFSEIVFCEGYQAIHNPYFLNIGMGPSKGEVLIVKIPGAEFRKMYKDKIFIIHLYDDIYWVGSGYEWDMPDDKPTQKAFVTLSNELKRVLLIPYEIVDHQAAIRPTMHARRPVFKVHKEIQGMYLFNGLGTKGSSIGPYAASKFARYIVEKNPNDLVI